MNASEIRARYPRPRRGPYDGISLFYCVGGALCLHIGRSTAYAFPSKTALAEALREANPGLTAGKSREFAHFIVYANDHSEFEDAWDFLDDALQWKRTPRGKRKAEPEPTPNSILEEVCI
jgi:hypothetical protein